MAAIQADPVAGPYAQEAFIEGQQRPTAVAGTQSAQAGANLAQLKQHIAHLNEVFSLAGSAKTPADLVRALRYGIDNNANTAAGVRCDRSGAQEPSEVPGLDSVHAAGRHVAPRAAAGRARCADAGEHRNRRACGCHGAVRQVHV